jgi:LCP family protein required for cell wall assembly
MMTALASALLGAFLMMVTPLPSAIAPRKDGDPLSIKEIWLKSFGYRITRPINILVMGIDLAFDESDSSIVSDSLRSSSDSEDLFAGRSDTMLLVRVDPITDTVSVLSIPRDTQVNIPDIGITKINHANWEGGPTLAAQTVSYTLNGVPIDRYVRISTDALRELIDLLGGVRVFVPERMLYEDKTQKLKIDLEPGWQTLNGDEAEQFARFRQDGFGDVGRVQRQQQLIRAMRDRLTDPTVLPKIPEAIQLFQTYIDTNLSLEEMLALAHFSLELNQDNFRMVMLPGRFSDPSEYIASYWLMDEVGRDQVMWEYFQVQPWGEFASQPDFNHLRIAVQNATGEPELGRQVADYLVEQGFNHVYVVQDWPDAQSQTQIIAQRGDLQGAAMLENILGLGQIIPASTGDLESDLTVRVGIDWLDQSGI